MKPIDLEKEISYTPLSGLDNGYIRLVGRINHGISGPSASDNQLETEYFIHSLMMGDKRRTDKLEEFYLAEFSNMPVGQLLKDLEIPPYGLN